MAQTKEQILETARKILNLKERAGTEGEAAAAAAALQRLLTEHQLSMLDVENVKDGAKLGVVKDFFESEYSALPAWCKQFAQYICKGFECHCILSQWEDKSYKHGTKFKAKIYFVGEESDAAIAKYFYITLSDQLFAESLKKAKYYSLTGTRRNEYRESFMLAAGKAIYERLVEERKQMVLESQKVGALVVLKGQLVSNFVKENFTNLVRGRGKAFNINGQGSSDGYVAGKQVSLTRGVGHSGESTRRIQ